MKTFLNLWVIFLWMSASGGLANADVPRQMTCQVWGCSTDSVSLNDDLDRWDLEFTEEILSDYDLNPDFSTFLLKAKLIGPKDRVDHVWLSINKSDCLEGHGIGDLTCNGSVAYGTMRIRSNEIYSTTTRGSSFTWKVISPSSDQPWNLQFRTLPTNDATMSQWIISMSVGGSTYAFYPILVNQCRNSF